jgi:hypothetical protein
MIVRAYIFTPIGNSAYDSNPFGPISTRKKMSHVFPHSQQAAVVQNPGESFKVVLRHDIPVGNPGPEEILVKLNCTGIW